MIGWLIGALGFGGIAAALFFVPGALPWTLGALKVFGGLVKRYPLQIALCASLAGNVWLWRGWSAEQDGRALDRQAYHAAQVEAQRRQDRADWANFTIQTERNTKLEESHAVIDTIRRTAVADYVAGHRVLACPAQGGPDRAASTGVHPDPGAPARTEPAAELVTIAPGELDQLATGAVHGTEATQFLNLLVAEGLAVPVP